MSCQSQTVAVIRHYRMSDERRFGEQRSMLGILSHDGLQIGTGWYPSRHKFQLGMAWPTVVLGYVQHAQFFPHRHVINSQLARHKHRGLAAAAVKMAVAL